ncbi:hypothetical protein [Neisseria sp. Marseille-Q6792]|uniref:hypothetical protein n=1 Tax=Neisseria sp. Marseille-Q6792 TaxID=2937985 RepID=UPI002023CD63|nr:hypothetical protein [Neisseria sp. Marseille-Q6792]
MLSPAYSQAWALLLPHTAITWICRLKRGIRGNYGVKKSAFTLLILGYTILERNCNLISQSRFVNTFQTAFLQAADSIAY